MRDCWRVRAGVRCVWLWQRERCEHAECVTSGAVGQSPSQPDGAVAQCHSGTVGRWTEHRALSSSMSAGNAGRQSDSWLRLCRCDTVALSLRLRTAAQCRSWLASAHCCRCSAHSRLRCSGTQLTTKLSHSTLCTRICKQPLPAISQANPPHSRSLLLHFLIRLGFAASMYQPLADGGTAVPVPALVESADWRALGPVRRGVARIALLASSNTTCGVPGYVWGKTLEHEPIKNALPIELRDVYTQEQFTALRRDMENLVQCQCRGE